MQFVRTAYDGEGMTEKRLEVRPLHLVGVERLKEHHVAAGGQLDGEGRLKGSVLIVESNKREDVGDYLANEFYVKKHVWEKITVEWMNVVQTHGEKVGS